MSFLNMSNNCLSDDLECADFKLKRPLQLRKLVLNGNKINWKTIGQLTKFMPELEDLHLSNNCLGNPSGEFGHDNIRQLFLTCNSMDSFEDINANLARNCPSLEVLSLAECPLKDVPNVENSAATIVECAGFSRLTTLNINTTKISSWEDIDNFRTFPKLVELRVKNCPLLDNYTAHERRMLLIARLPNIFILNGGDKIPANEREDAERGFIRFYLNEEEKPSRYHELVKVHGILDPLVNVSMKPDTHVKVTISAHQETDVREELIPVKQTVGQFKAQLNQWFHIPIQNMKLFYCDQVLLEATGPEEMKFPQKALYTYNVRSGDSFIVDEKAPPLPKLKPVNPSSRMSAAYSPNPQLSSTSPYYPQGQRHAVTFAVIDRKKLAARSQKTKNINVKRNLFSGDNETENSENPEPIPDQPFKIWPEEKQQSDKMDVDAGNNNHNDSVDSTSDQNAPNIRNHSVGE